MRRRRFLALAGLGSSGALGGCLDLEASGTPTASPTATPVAEIGGVELPVSTGEMRTPLPEDAIPAITDPAFGDDWRDWSAVPPEHRPDTPPALGDTAPVVGAARGGEARAYPLAVLNWHEVVNDRFDGPLLVTYCPLCGSAVVAERTVRGEPTTFGVSGRLWRNNLVLYDERTRSYWSQLLAAAIRGPATGERLSLLPSSFTTWGDWRTDHPDGRVLLPPPGSATVSGRRPEADYANPKYGYGEQSQLVGVDDDGSGKLHPRALVVGVAREGTARAYPFEVLREEGVVEDRVSGLPVVVALAPGGSLVAYERTVEGRTLAFEADGAAHLRAGGSRWERTTGRAVDGPYAGATLSRANDRSPMFWRAWRDFHPETDVYGREG